MSLIKVTMNISERDRENANFLKEALACRSQAHVVSIAMELLRFLVDARREQGAELLLRYDTGDVERVVVPELNKVQKETEAQAATAASSGL